MPSPNATTVVLTRKAQALKTELMLDHGGLKHVLSAALILFAALPGEEQRRLIRESRLGEAEEAVRDAEEQAKARAESRRQKNPRLPRSGGP